MDPRRLESQPSQKSRSTSKLIAAILSLIWMMAAWGPCFAGQIGQPEADSARRLIPLLLNTRWKELAEEATRVPSDSYSGVISLIKAHAYLALNRNNESCELFASAAWQNYHDRWDEWTKRLLGDHQDNAVAWYLRGDALARLKRWKEAEKAFDEALKIKPGWYLALNARGVVRHAQGDIYGAEEDFEAAIGAKPDFADAYASLGTLNYCTHTADHIKSRFEQAQQHSQDKDKFVLALNGIACDRYVWQRYEEAQAIFDKVPADSSLSVLARANSVAAALGALEETIENSDEKARMSIEAKVFRGGKVFANRMPWETGHPVADKIPPTLRIGATRVILLPNGTIVIVKEGGRIEIIGWKPPDLLDTGGGAALVSPPEKAEASEPATPDLDLETSVHTGTPARPTPKKRPFELMSEPPTGGAASEAGAASTTGGLTPSGKPVPLPAATGGRGNVGSAGIGVGTSAPTGVSGRSPSLGGASTGGSHAPTGVSGRSPSLGGASTGGSQAGGVAAMPSGNAAPSSNNPALPGGGGVPQGEQSGATAGGIAPPGGQPGGAGPPPFAPPVVGAKEGEQPAATAGGMAPPGGQPGGAGAGIPVESLPPAPIPTPIEDRLGILTGQPILRSSTTRAEQFSTTRAEQSTALPGTSLTVSPVRLPAVQPLRASSPLSGRLVAPVPEVVMAQVTRYLNGLRQEIRQQVPHPPATSPGVRIDPMPRPGGVIVKTKDISRPRRGPWCVTSVYGLLYEVPLEPKK